MKIFFLHVTTFGLRTAPISNCSFNLSEVHSWLQTNSCCPSIINRRLTLRPLAVHNIPCNRGFCWHNDRTRPLLQTPQSLWPRLQRFTLFRLGWHCTEWHYCSFLTASACATFDDAAQHNRYLKAPVTGTLHTLYGRSALYILKRWKYITAILLRI